MNQSESQGAATMRPTTPHLKTNVPMGAHMGESAFTIQTMCALDGKLTAMSVGNQQTHFAPGVR